MSLEEFYKTEIKEVFELIEIEQKKANKNALNVLAIGAFITAMVYLLTKSLIAIVCAFFTIIIIIFILYLAGNEISIIFKSRALMKLVNFISPTMSYTPNGSISQKNYINSEIYSSNYDRYKGEDLFSGQYANVDLSFSELKVEKKHETRNSKGHRQTYYETIFKGIFMITDFHKHFSGVTLVVPDLAEKSFGQVIGNFLQKKNFARRGEVTRMENPEFEKEFAVYTTDIIESRYILSPALMENMLNISKKFGSRVAFSFKESKLFIAIETEKNFFETPHQRNFKSIEKIYLDISQLFEIVNNLSLNIRLWTKK